MNKPTTQLTINVPGTYRFNGEVKKLRQGDKVALPATHPWCTECGEQFTDTFNGGCIQRCGICLVCLDKELGEQYTKEMVR